MKHLLNWGPLTNDLYKPQCLHLSLCAEAEAKVRISEMSAGQVSIFPTSPCGGNSLQVLTAQAWPMLLSSPQRGLFPRHS